MVGFGWALNSLAYSKVGLLSELLSLGGLAGPAAWLQPELAWFVTVSPRDSSRAVAVLPLRAPRVDHVRERWPWGPAPSQELDDPHLR